MNKVIEITDQNFEGEVQGSDLSTEVDFWVPWCGPRMMVSTIYDKLSQEYDGRFKFCKINVNENQRTATKYQIMYIPMQMLFADGQKVDETLGAVPEHTIRTMVVGILQSFPTEEKESLKSFWHPGLSITSSIARKLGSGQRKPKMPRMNRFPIKH